MAGFVIGAAEVATQRWVKAEMIEGVVRGKKRRSQVVVTLGDKNMEERILGHGPPQRLRNIYVLIFIRRVVPRPHAAGEHFIRQVAVEFEVVAYIVIQHARIRADNCRDAGIELRPFAGSIAIDAREARVDAADGAALAAQEFFREALDFDAPVVAVEVIRRESVEPRTLLR